MASVSGSTVTLVNKTGFSVGDKIIIESQHGYNQDGLDGNWTWNFVGYSGDFYFDPALKQGKSFMGSITGISGETITLDRTVPVGAVGLPFHRDNGDAVKHAIENGVSWPSGVTFHVGSNADFIRPALSTEQQTIDFNNCTWLNVRGCPGLLFYPNTIGGSSSVSNKVFKNLNLVGNSLNSGFGVQSLIGLNALVLIAGSNVVVDNFTTRNGWRGIVLNNSVDCVVQNCTSTLECHRRRYIQWEFQASGCSRCVFYNCTVDCDFPFASFEPFKCSGVSFVKCGGRNAGYSCNASGKIKFIDCNCTYDSADYETEGASSWSINNPIININRIIENQQGTPQTGTEGGCLVYNFDMAYEALPRVASQRIFKCIIVGGGIRGISTDARIRNVSYTNPFLASTDGNGNAVGYVISGDANTLGANADQLIVSGIVNATTLNTGLKYSKQGAGAEVGILP